MTKKTFKSVFVSAIILVVCLVGLIGYNLVTYRVGAGYVGYVYDRTISVGSENTIPGTSVINVPRTGRIYINPFTQEIIKYPTTIVTRNWTAADEEHKGSEDYSMQVGSKEGKNITTDVYVSVKPDDMSKLISSFGLKTFDSIIDDDIYGLVKGKLNIIAQTYSIYDVQSSRAEIQENTFNLLKDVLKDVYGIDLIRFEIGTITLPTDIQAKIDQKTEAINAVELAKLEREKQDEINQKIVDEQKAESEKELLKRQSEADAAAYEKEKAAEAELTVADNAVKVAELQVEEARLQKEAELEKQKAYTEEYFRDKELDVKMEAVAKINSSVKTIITDGSGSGYAGLAEMKEILDSLE